MERCVRLQFDTYREMRGLAEAEWAQPRCAATEDANWAKFTPGTNAVWVVYLCDMLRLKRFKGLEMSKAEKKSLTSFRCAFCPCSSRSQDCKSESDLMRVLQRQSQFSIYRVA